MQSDADVVWRGRPWIGPSLVARTIGAAVVAVVLLAVFSSLGMLGMAVLSVPFYLLALALIVLVWFASVMGLLIMRASFRYVLRQSSVEINQGIVGKRSLVVSPSAFSELEVDQGIVGRILNYGSLEVRSQGGQQLNFMLIRDPSAVAAKIRGVMSVPTVRLAKEERAPAPRSG